MPFTTDTVCLGKTDVSKLYQEHSITRLPPSGCDRCGQVGATLVGQTFGRAYVMRSCLCNAVNALVKRHGVPPPKATADFPLPTNVCDAIYYAYSQNNDLFEVWELKQPLRRAIATAKSIYADTIQPSRNKSFIKREVLEELKDKGRLIQAYPNRNTSDCYAREFYVWQKALNMVFSLDEPFEVFPGVRATFASGANADDIGRWMDLAVASIPKHYLVEMDGKSWDATMQRIHHELKTSSMRRCCPELANFVDLGFATQGVVIGGTGKLKYTLHGTVKSGHNDTTSGNSLVNMMIWSYVFHRLGVKAYIIVAGDDMLAVCDSDPGAGRIIGVASEYGIRPAGRVFSDVMDCTFISGCWLPDTTGKYWFIPILGRLLRRLWWTTNPPSYRKISDYRYSVCMGLFTTCANLPMYRELLSAGVPKASLIPIDKHAYTPFVTSMPGNVVGSMLVKYGISHDQMREFCEFLAAAPQGPSYRSHPVADIIIARDLADIGDRPGLAHYSEKRTHQSPV